MQEPQALDLQVKVARTIRGAEEIAAKIQHAFNLPTFHYYFTVYVSNGLTFDPSLQKVLEDYARATEPT